MKFIDDLENILHVPESSYGKYHKDSIMDSKIVCDCDPAHLCEHRKKYIINYIYKNLRIIKLDSL